MKNDYEIRGDVTAIFINSPKYGLMETLISTSKLSLVKEHTGFWKVHFDPKNKYFYVNGFVSKVKKKQTYRILHRFVTGAEQGSVVDHINHNTLDNTDGNLRVITNAQNCQNRKGPNKNSTSGVRGVSWNKGAGKWVVKIRIAGAFKHIGYFSSLDDATEAATEARMRHMPYAHEELL